MKSITREPKVLLPHSLELSDYVGDLFGYFHPRTNVYNILAWDDESQDLHKHRNLHKIGTVIRCEGAEELLEEPYEEDLIVGIRTAKGLSFKVVDTPCRKEHYNLVQNIFSRNTGILETDWLVDKTAFILGCGSVGSFVALELAKAGVGKIVLVDNDTVEYHNLCRHQCGIHDVGNYKTLAIKDRILAINPSAEVFTYEAIVERLEKEVFDQHCRQGTVLIGCADNREADVYASKIANIYSIPLVSIGFWERAFAGEIFYFIPTEDMPCYECALGSGSSTTSARVSTNRRIYTTQEDLEMVNFEPGIAVDIDFVTLVAVKLILDILNRDNPRFTPRVIEHLTQFTLVCNTNEPEIGGKLAEIFTHPLQITHSIRVDYRDSCPPCKYR